MNGTAESLRPLEDSSGCSRSSSLQLKFPFLLQTASTLVVADSRISGIYSCMASNKVGAVERNISFYVTGKPHTLYSPREPGDLAVLSVLFVLSALRAGGIFFFFLIPQNC